MFRESPFSQKTANNLFLYQLPKETVQFAQHGKNDRLSKTHTSVNEIAIDLLYINLTSDDDLIPRFTHC